MPTSVPIVWRKSSKSQGAENCIEVADISEGMCIRDAKFSYGPSLTVSALQWIAFLTAVKRGQLDPM